MSIESAKSFVGKMQGDEGFATAFWACGDNEAKKHFLAHDGYNFGLGELMQAMQEMNVRPAVMGGAVAGGSCCGCTHEGTDSFNPDIPLVVGAACCSCTHEGAEWAEIGTDIGEGAIDAVTDGISGAND